MLTSNQRYGAMNRRFDKRAARLRGFGFQYVANEFGAFFVRTKLNRKQVIPACFALLADNVVWIDRLKMVLDR